MTADRVDRPNWVYRCFLNPVTCLMPSRRRAMTCKSRSLIFSSTTTIPESFLCNMGNNFVDISALHLAIPFSRDNSEIWRVVTGTLKTAAFLRSFENSASVGFDCINSLKFVFWYRSFWRAINFGYSTDTRLSYRHWYCLFWMTNISMRSK